MITNYYQLWLFPFLSLRKRPLPRGVSQRFYHSFEDGLWHILQYRDIPKNSVILVPDFYCTDVVNNIRTHGYTPVYYGLDKHFQISTVRLRAMIRQRRPGAVIIFHAAGVTSHTKIPNTKRTLIIEDCVHRIVDGNTLRIRHKNHYVLDSLRKVTPLPGSRMFGKNSTIPDTHTPAINGYFLRSFAWFILFRIAYVSGMLIHWPQLVRFSHEVILKHHDDVIGDNPTPTQGLSWPLFFADRINVTRIANIKVQQVKLYRLLLSGLPRSYDILLNTKEFGNLHAYPLTFRGAPRPDLISHLHKRGIVVWYKFPDSPWSKRRSVIFLPLGPHVRNVDIAAISNALHHWPAHPPLSRE